MHIVDGALAPAVIGTGSVLAVAGLAYGLKTLKAEAIPLTGVLTAAFFIASLVQVPLGPSSVHLILNGLLGLVLGWAAFPAMFVGLLLQAVFFGFGGLTVLGVNTLNIALPAVLVFLICRKGVADPRLGVALFWGVLAGAGAVFLTTMMVTFSLALSGDEFITSAKVVVFAHIPLMIVEGVVAGAAVMLATRVRPDLFQAARQAE